MTDKSKERVEVEKLLKQCEDITNITEELIIEWNRLKTVSKQTKSFKQNQEKYAKQIMENQELCEDFNKALKKISEKLKNINDEKIKNLENKMQIAIEQKKKAIEDKGYQKRVINTLENEIQTLNKKYEKELEHMSKHGKLKKTLLFCKKAMEVAQKLKDEIMEEIRREIEKKTSTHFFEMIWKILYNLEKIV